MQFRPDIQGLRAIAVLAVIIFHFNPAWLPGGFVGVDIFLVISGYLIASILLYKKSKPEYRLAATVSYFYISRFKRIIPAYFVVLILVSFLAAVLFLQSDFSIYRDGLKKAIWFNSNNYFSEFGDYFAPASYEQPLLHTWSLAIEIQFYLIAPFIFLFVPNRFLIWLLPLAIILLTAFAEYRLHQGMLQATYYSLPARLPAFLLGSCIAVLMTRKSGPSISNRQKLWLNYLAIALIAFAFVIPKPTGYFPGIAGLIPIIGTALLIWLNANNRVTAFLSTKTLVWIGTLSYSLYLWHWPVLAFMRYYTGSEILDWEFSLAFIGLTLALSVASYYWVETPLRQKRSKIRLTGYACLVLVTLSTAAGIKKVNVYFTPEPLPVEYRRYADPATICHGKIVGDCLKGDLTSEKEVLVLGDSHAAMLNSFFHYLGKELGFKARIITASSCVTIPGFDHQRIPEYAYKACVRQIGYASKHLEQASMIFLAGKWSRHFDFASFSKSIGSFFGSINPEKKLYVFGQVPFLKMNPLRSNRFLHLNLPGSKDELERKYIHTNALMEEKISQQGININYLNINGLNIFQSLPVYDGKIIYQDQHHLNENGAFEYSKQFLPAMQAILND